jgi:lipopolysaccharide/colanic/teichoic acid biosynthesis glycosyltransferase
MNSVSTDLPGSSTPASPAPANSGDPSTKPGGTPEAAVDHWGQPADDRTVRRWRRRLRYKKLAWRATYEAAERLKRTLDITGAAAAITAFGPVFVATAIAIKLEDGGPILFRQKRVGRGGRLFDMFKFRSMVPNAEAIKAQLEQANQHGESGVTFKIKDDPRITKVGYFIRKYSIDEFPQFFNVLRPALPKEVARYKAIQLRRLRIRPGITCLWQVNGRSEIDFEGQVRLDLQYIASENIRTDVKLLLETIPAVLKGDGAY